MYTLYTLIILWGSHKVYGINGCKLESLQSTMVDCQNANGMNLVDKPCNLATGLVIDNTWGIIHLTNCKLASFQGKRLSCLTMFTQLVTISNQSQAVISSAFMRVLQWEPPSIAPRVMQRISKKFRASMAVRFLANQESKRDHSLVIVGKHLAKSTNWFNMLPIQ